MSPEEGLEGLLILGRYKQYCSVVPVHLNLLLGRKLPCSSLNGKSYFLVESYLRPALGHYSWHTVINTGPTLGHCCCHAESSIGPTCLATMKLTLGRHRAMRQNDVKMMLDQHLASIADNDGPTLAHCSCAIWDFTFHGLSRLT